MDKLSTLRFFRQVAEVRSFTQAARQLGVSPAMVSKSIQQLERSLGALLFVRSSRTVTTTEVGERYLQSVGALLDELALAEQQLHQSVAQPRGELRLTAPVDLGEGVLPGVIRDFCRECPDVSVSLDLSNRHVNLRDESIDLALRVGNITRSSLVVRSLGDLPLVVCAAPSYLEKAGPIRHPKELVQHRCLVNPSVGDPLRWRFRDKGKPLSVHANAVLQSNSARMLIQAASDGLGVVYIPAYLVKKALAARTLVPVLNQYVLPALPLSLVYLQRRLQPVKVRKFIDHLVHHVRADAL